MHDVLCIPGVYINALGCKQANLSGLSACACVYCSPSAMLKPMELPAFRSQISSDVKVKYSLIVSIIQLFIEVLR